MREDSTNPKIVPGPAGFRIALIRSKMKQKNFLQMGNSKNFRWSAIPRLGKVLKLYIGYMNTSHIYSQHISQN